MMDWDRINDELTRPLDKRHVKPPAPGKYGDYIEGWWAIAEANEVFGHGNWTRDTFRMEETCREFTEGKGMWRVGYLCQVRITVGDVERVGTGYGQGNSKSLPDAIESAAKEAETDATKRALMTFGWRFGLALYDKSKDHVADPAEIERQAKAEATAAEKIALLESCETVEELTAMWKGLDEWLRARDDVKDAAAKAGKALKEKKEAA